ncbi:hypothetical protein BV25DRAFT_1797254, partial [Artomyces pyxidatus]
MRDLKVSAPIPWNGRADLDTYDKWVYEVESWRRLTGVDDETALTLMGKFVTNKPSHFYMKYVSKRIADWTVEEFYQAVFNYCFPTDFKNRLRKQLMSAKQGKDDVGDFVQELETLGNRFPDITNDQMVRIFWDGLQQYLRLYLIEQGLDPEVTPLETMVTYAERRERAY